MKNTRSLIYGRLTVTALVYSLAVVSSSIWALINSGAESCMSSVFLVTLLGATLLSEVVDVLLCRLIDNSWLYLAIDFVAIAVIFVGSGILFNWFPPTVGSILVCVAIVLAIFILVNLFFIGKNRAASKRINEKLHSAE